MHPCRHGTLASRFVNRLHPPCIRNANRRINFQWREALRGRPGSTSAGTRLVRRNRIVRDIASGLPCCNNDQETKFLTRVVGICRIHGASGEIWRGSIVANLSGSHCGVMRLGSLVVVAEEWKRHEYERGQPRSSHQKKTREQPKIIRLPFSLPYPGLSCDVSATSPLGVSTHAPPRPTVTLCD